MGVGRRGPVRKRRWGGVAKINFKCDVVGSAGVFGGVGHGALKFIRSDSMGWFTERVVWDLWVYSIFPPRW